MAAISRRALMIAAVAALSACNRSADGPPKADFKATDITGADYARDLDLPDVAGQRRHISDFKGKVVVVFFGYTQCPDVCPTTMVELAAVRKALGADGARVQGVFVTVDPERDTPEVLKAYIDNFGADFVGLRGTPEETREAARQFKIYYAKVPGKAEGSYTMDHTAASFIFDPQGRVRLFSRYGSGAEALKHDIELLLKQA